jgi:uncharacterized protein YcaQ
VLPAASKRKYGYFVLPILRNGSWLAAWTPKRAAKKATGSHQTVSGRGNPPEEALLADLADTLRAYAAWQGLNKVQISASEPPGAAARLNALLAR